MTQNPTRPGSEVAESDDQLYYARLFRAQQARAATRALHDDVETTLNVAVRLPPVPAAEPPADEQAVAIEELPIDPGSLLPEVRTVTVDLVPPAEGRSEFTVAPPGELEFTATVIPPRETGTSGERRNA